jgi:hypothetical protein
LALAVGKPWVRKMGYAAGWSEAERETESIILNGNRGWRAKEFLNLGCKNETPVSRIGLVSGAVTIRFLLTILLRTISLHVIRSAYYKAMHGKNTERNYGIGRLEARGLIEALKSEDRRNPYRLTGLGERALRARLDSMMAVVRAGQRRLASA